MKKSFLKNFFLLVAFAFSALAFADTSIYSGNAELNWSSTVNIAASKFANVSQGSVITLNLKKSRNEYQNVKMYSPTQYSGWKELNSGKLTNASYSGAIVPKFSSSNATVTYSLTSEDAENLKKFGLIMHGYGVVVNSMTVSGGNGSVTTGSVSTSSTTTNTGSTTANAPSESVVFSGSKDFTSWSTNINIPSSKLSGIGNESKILVTMTKSKTAREYQNLKMYAAKNSGWLELKGGSYENASYSGVIVPQFNSSKITVAYSLTQDNVNALKSNGLILQGYGIVVSEVKIGVSTSSTTANSSGSVTTNSTTANTGSVTTSSTTTTAANPVPASVSGTPFANHGKLHVSGAYLMDSKNQKYQLYGMSTHGLNFGNDFSKFVNEDAFKTLRDDWNTNCIRLVLYPGDYNGYCNGGNKAELKRLIENGVEYATKLGMYVIVDWHVHNFNPNNQWKSDAKTFLSEISRKYANYGNVLYEICNEPTSSPWNSSIKPFAEEIIPAIRANAPDAVIIVGTNTWSQDIEEPLANPLRFNNVMYTFHFYANTHTENYRNRVKSCIEKGLPVFVTEFGTCDASGNGGFNANETQKWFDLCQKYNISHMDWSLSNKSETASAIQSWCSKTSNWSDNELTESGKLVKNHFRTLKR